MPGTEELPRRVREAQAVVGGNPWGSVRARTALGPRQLEQPEALPMCAPDRALPPAPTGILFLQRDLPDFRDGGSKGNGAPFSPEVCSNH